MKRSFTIITFILLMALLFPGCTPEPVEPSPSPSAAVIPSPAMTPNVSPDANSSPGGGLDDATLIPDNTSGGSAGNTDDAGGSGGTGGVIEGFEEGKSVDVASVPEVTAAIKKEYPDATIKSITHETYMSAQMYHVILEGSTGGDMSTELYVSPDGEITPKAGASASPNS